MSKQIELSVKGMSCEHCVKSVRETLSALPGVSDVDVNLKKERAQLRADDGVQENDLIQAVNALGFTATQAEAKQKGGLFGIFRGKKG